MINETEIQCIRNGVEDVVKQVPYGEKMPMEWKPLRYEPYIKEKDAQQAPTVAEESQKLMEFLIKWIINRVSTKNKIPKNHIDLLS